MRCPPVRRPEPADLLQAELQLSAGVVDGVVAGEAGAVTVERQLEVFAGLGQVVEVGGIDEAAGGVRGVADAQVVAEVGREQDRLVEGGIVAKAPGDEEQRHAGDRGS